MKRRSFLAASLLAPAVAQSPLKASDVVDRIWKNVGAKPRANTVDRIVAGEPDTVVGGIASTMMATFDVLQRAAREGKNMVITHEPTYWLHQDTTADIANNAAYQAKLRFIRENQMVIFRLHDSWHDRNPDGINLGMARELGWESRQTAPNSRRYRFENMTLGKLVADIQRRVRPTTMRVVGNADLPVDLVAASWGFLSRDPAIQILSDPEVDVLICGETREWEGVEFVQDQIAAGQQKALIVMGHVVSEQAGMKLFAEWLKPLVREVPVGFVAASEPFWGRGSR